MSKKKKNTHTHTHKGENQNQVHEVKTFENLKYEPVLRTYKTYN